jgi:hypothetical protein
MIALDLSPSSLIVPDFIPEQHEEGLKLGPNRHVQDCLKASHKYQLG